MNMLENHLEQITMSCATINELPFPPPRIFTNALLHPHDITTLIRDTEAHERALFAVATEDGGSFEPAARKSGFYGGHQDRRTTTIGYRGLKPTTAVGKILGGDLMTQIKRVGRDASLDRLDVDVKALLKGAEKLCGVYPVVGAMEKISVLRSRHEQLAESIMKYESKVAKQAALLNEMNYSRDDHGLEAFQGGYNDSKKAGRVFHSAEDLRQEEEEIRELEEKAKGLEERVSGMERDLGGLMR